MSMLNSGLQRIIDLVRLERGWDGNSASPISWRAIQQAIDIKLILDDLQIDSVKIRPTKKGGIQFKFTIHPNHYLRIRVSNKGKINYDEYYSSGEYECYKRPIQFINPEIVLLYIGAKDRRKDITEL